MTFGNNYDVKELDNILAKAKMSPKLREAIQAIKEAMEKGDRELVANLSAVKSFITPTINPKAKNDAFQEDEAYNEKKFDDSLYSYLDGLHFKYALATGTIPSGVIEYSLDGFKSRDTPKSKHPILKLMNEEDEAIKKEIEREHSKRARA